MRQLIYTKCDRGLLQNASGFLLQNATVLLQNVTVITNCNDFITKCDSYYKMQRSLQIATVYRSFRLVLQTIQTTHSFKSTSTVFFVNFSWSHISFFILAPNMILYFELDLQRCKLKQSL